jgi:L-malate glycosyltransferase
MNKKTRVLIFANSFRIGGSERQAVELFKRLDRSRFEPILACFQKDGPLLEELPGSCGEVQAFPLSGFFNLTALRQAWRFLALLRRSRVQIVQCFDFYSNVFAIPLARIAGVPVIMGCRREEALTKTPAQRMVERWSYRLATGVIANAEAIKEQVVERDGIRSGKIWTIHNGLDLARFDPQRGSCREDLRDERKEIVVAVVANLRPEKGHLIFLQAASRLATENPRVRFLIVGEGPERTRIEGKIGELGLTEMVDMRGEVRDIPGLFRAVDIAVLPSLMNEGFPNSVMEAMGASIPVVATDSGGTRELVMDGYTGFVVQPGDAAAMADRIGNLCADRERRRKMGEAGLRRMVEGFTVEKMAKQFEFLYLKLLRKRGSMEGI